MAAFRLTPAAIDDLDTIWSYIFRDNPGAADAVEDALRSEFEMLAQNPLLGHVRRDLSKLDVRFWTLPRYPKYVIVYRANTKPLEVVRVLHGMRDVKRILRELPPSE